VEYITEDRPGRLPPSEYRVSAAEAEDPQHILVTDGLHCGVEKIGGLVVDHLRERPVSNVVTYNMHPKAVDENVRFVDKSELGSLFSPKLLLMGLGVYDRSYIDVLSQDEQAIVAYHSQPPSVIPPCWLGIDPHSAAYKGANALVTSHMPTPVHIAVGKIFGLSNVIVMPDYPFYSICPMFVSIETEEAAHNPLQDPAVWRRNIQTIADLGKVGMFELGLAAAPEMKFYQEVDLWRVDENGEPLPTNCELIEHLESIPQPEGYFTPLADKAVTSSPLVPPGRTICIGHWDDKNKSRKRPELLGYRADGRARREVFGSLMLPLTYQLRSAQESRPDSPLLEFTDLWQAA
jgi:hypothetical protein